MPFSWKEFVYNLKATDKYSDYDLRKSFNRVNKPTAETSLLYAHQNNSSLTSLGQTSSPTDGIHEVRLAWRHIKIFIQKLFPELDTSLLSACTESDLNELQKDLGITLPPCVIEFYRMTDGQSSINSNGSGGLFFGLKLLALEEIAVQTQYWREVAKQCGSDASTPPKSPIVTAESDLGAQKTPEKAISQRASHFGIPTQESIPPNAIILTYAHEKWVPLVVDDSGNCIALDLSDHKSDEYTLGQVIIFGRDFDIKVKLADNFGDFLLLFANDLEKGNWATKDFADDADDIVCGVESELIFLDRKSGMEKLYLDALRERSVNKWKASLSEAERKLENFLALLGRLLANTSYHVPTFTQNTDRLINENLHTVEDFEAEQPTAVS